MNLVFSECSSDIDIFGCLYSTNKRTLFGPNHLGPPNQSLSFKGCTEFICSTMIQSDYTIVLMNNLIN